ncbi:uncharacterized protein F5147DRAFT_779798 [Suillus discolor]|uniref:Uncharacterized protein n=1 Tax=Suillus discolor TaxID=1912936 RepID=A0A9P7EWC7_9AGAM|nr:uncharacterized protein F5147DRAFT_779798 [Suillus discolor]KAG2091944.1 hypothetical protein F5147DRAFT_779798 [Suillus discolor]
MTSNNPSSVSSSHAVDALVTALMNLNMSSVTAHALVTIIQAIADGGQTIPSAAVHPGQKDHTADCDVEDNADEGAEATPASTTTPPLSSTTLAPDIGSIAEAIAKLSLCNNADLVGTNADLVGTNADLVGTNADLVGLPPRSVSYKGFPYEIPDLSAEGPFYCVIKGKRVGVLATWYAFFLALSYALNNQPTGKTLLPKSRGSVVLSIAAVRQLK